MERQCTADALAILRHLGRGAQAFRVTGPEITSTLANVRPPAGGEVRDWDVHYIVQFEGRIYDSMTGLSGMDMSRYRSLYEYPDAIKFQAVSAADLEERYAADILGER